MILPSNRKGFTLIELLVVLAIMVLLMSIIIPGTNQAFERAKTTGCMSNLKQLSAAILQYATDRQGELPPFQVITSQMGYNTSWAAELVRNGYVDAPMPTNPNNIPKISIFRCPSGLTDALWDGTTPSDPWSFTNAHLRPWASETNRDGSTRYVHTWYGINGRTEPDNTTNRGYPFIRPWNIKTRSMTTEIQPMDKIVMLYDGFWSHNAVPNRITARHNNRRSTNFSFMDGRVETIRTRVFNITDTTTKELYPRFRNLD